MLLFSVYLERYIMNDEERMRAEILAMRERGDQITDEVPCTYITLLIYVS